LHESEPPGSGLATRRAAPRQDNAMSIEKIEQPVRVLVDCSNGELSPLRFLRNGRTYRIEQVNGRWTDRAGDGETLHFSVQVGDETCYLHFDLAACQWWLDQIITEG
jgi:hypothetical protein